MGSSEKYKLMGFDSSLIPNMVFLFLFEPLLNANFPWKNIWETLHFLTCFAEASQLEMWFLLECRLYVYIALIIRLEVWIDGTLISHHVLYMWICLRMGSSSFQMMFFSVGMTLCYWDGIFYLGKPSKVWDAFKFPFLPWPYRFHRQLCDISAFALLGNDF